MPTLTIDIKDLKSQLKSKVTDTQLQEILPLNKIEIEAWGSEAKVEITPDRPDLFSVEGIARQLDSWLGTSKGLKNYSTQKPIITVKNTKVACRPYFVSAIVRGVALTDSTIKSVIQLQELLDLTLGRGRKKSSIGLHDITQVKPPFTYKEVSPTDVEFIPLGTSKKMNLKQILEKHPKGKLYAHILNDAKKYPLLVDANDNVLSFPPIINGELTKVTEKTTDIFLDITGLDETTISYALNILVTSLEKRGGTLESVIVNGKTYPILSARNMKIDFNEIRRLMGANLKESECIDLLARMGYGYNKKSKEISIPPYRPDILHHVDIIEDVIIGYGLNNIKPETPRHHSVGRLLPLESFAQNIRHLLVGQGFQEVMNFSLLSKEKYYTRMHMTPKNQVEITNPLSEEYVFCRQMLIPSLLDTFAQNKHRKYPQQIFEIADCLIPNDKEETGVHNVKTVSFATSHSTADFSAILSSIHSLNESLGSPWTLRDASSPLFLPGRCGEIMLGKKPIGLFGEIHPKILTSWSLEKPVGLVEINIDVLFQEYVTK